MKYTFSGHESFQCKSLWLKKGYDYVNDGYTFTDDNAVVELGAGKNMVSSIRYWLKAFGITEENGKLSNLGHLLFGKEGFDLFLEDLNTLWLLHYSLVSTQYASIYNIFFSDFIRNRYEFSKDQLTGFLKRLFTEKSFGKTPYNENTLSRDISTLLKNYVRPKATKNFDDFSAVLLDLNLIKQTARDQYAISVSSKAQINPLIFLFAVLDRYPEETVIEYQKILDLATIFCLNQNELYDIFDELHVYNPAISFSNTAGEQLFSIKEQLDKWQVLKDYYKMD